MKISRQGLALAFVAILGGIALGLAAVSIAQAQELTGTGTATLTWTPPDAFTNGDPLPLSAIEKYTIYWGTESGVYPNTLDVQNGAVQSYVLDLEVTGPTTFYFAMSAWARGLESAKSNEASKTITLEVEDVPPGAPQSVTVDLTFSCETSDAGRLCRIVVE